MDLNDSLLDELRKPMLMAEEEESEEELFSTESLAEEEAAAEAEALAAAQAFLAETSEEKVEEPGLRIGFRRSLIGYSVLLFLGLLPLIGLVLFFIAEGELNLIMMIFFFIYLIGWVAALLNLKYHLSHGYEFFNDFNIRTYFKLWPEITVISIILLGLSFWNISAISKGNFMKLSNKKPSQLQEDLLDLQKQQFGLIIKRIERSSKKNNSSEFEVQEEEEIIISLNNPDNFKLAQTIESNEKKEITEEKTESTNDKKTSKIKKYDKKVNVVGGIVGGSIGKTDYPEQESPNLVGGILGAVKGAYPTTEMWEIYKPREIPSRAMHPIVKKVFLNGILGSLFGYAFVVAIAGALFAFFRKFNTPISEKKIEIFNEETGELTTNIKEPTPINKVLNVLLFRIPIGFTFGGTIGFLLGMGVILPLYFLFGKNHDPDLGLVLWSLGVIQHPDFSYAYGIISAGIFVPLVLLFVGKLSPPGLSVTEQQVKDVYALPSIVLPAVSDKIPEPAVIKFGEFDTVEEEEKEEKIKPEDLLSDLSITGDESLTAEILSEFGEELEQVFGSDVTIKSEEGNGLKDRRKMATILEESFGELGHVSVEISAELGHASIMLTDWLNLKEGTLIELDKPATDEIDVLLNGVPKAKGNLTVKDNYIGVEITSIREK